MICRSLSFGHNDHSVFVSFDIWILFVWVIFFTGLKKIELVGNLQDAHDWFKTHAFLQRIFAEKNNTSLGTSTVTALHPLTATTCKKKDLRSFKWYIHSLSCSYNHILELLRASRVTYHQAAPQDKKLRLEDAINATKVLPVRLWLVCDFFQGKRWVTVKAPGYGLELSGNMIMEPSWITLKTTWITVKAAMRSMRT